MKLKQQITVGVYEQLCRFSLAAKHTVALAEYLVLVIQPGTTLGNKGGMHHSVANYAVIARMRLYRTVRCCM